ncbi:MAG: hypothetical protein P8M53_04470 [Pirellulales bacterium]|jgi:hypothetical protein|nr:hypothetical protein [Pirellulales bacterium]
MNCTWTMYRQSYGGSFRYLCGLYQQQRSCSHNHVDGPLATRFALGSLRQRMLKPGLHAKLERRLEELARRHVVVDQRDVSLREKQAELDSLKIEREAVQANLARAKT